MTTESREGWLKEEGRGSDRACLGQARLVQRGKGSTGDKEDRGQRYRRCSVACELLGDETNQI